MYGLLAGTKKLVVVESWPLAEIHRRRRRTRDLTKPRRRNHDDDGNGNVKKQWV